MKIQSLGYRTDLAILALGGSTVIDHGDHLVIRTAASPDYWWGNFLLARDLKAGAGTGWAARFAAEFPGARHIALGVDDPGAPALVPGAPPGMTMEQHAVMTAAAVHAPTRPHTEAVFRTLVSDGDWQQSLQLSAAVHAGEPGGEAFLAGRLAAHRALAEAGHGAWHGAFLDGALVSQCGLISVGTAGLARYQSVETHPAARRRGLAGTLVWRAGAGALADGAGTLVMVADPDDVAISVYRSVGFTVTESQTGFIRPPDAE